MKTASIQQCQLSYKMKSRSDVKKLAEITMTLRLNHYVGLQELIFAFKS